MPVKNPKDSPLTVLASDDTESKALDLNMMVTFQVKLVAMRLHCTGWSKAPTIRTNPNQQSINASIDTNKQIKAIRPKNGSIKPKATKPEVAKAVTMLITTAILVKFSISIVFSLLN
jgi:hypothetical protein